MSRREQALARASKRLKGVEGARLCPFAEQETADQQSGHTGLGAPTGHPWGWTLGGDPALSARSGTTSQTSPGVPGTALDSEAAVRPAAVPGPPPLALLSQASPEFTAAAGHLACWRYAEGPEQPAFLLFWAPFACCKGDGVSTAAPTSLPPTQDGQAPLGVTVPVLKCRYELSRLIARMFVECMYPVPALS